MTVISDNDRNQAALQRSCPCSCEPEALQHPMSASGALLIACLLQARVGLVHRRNI